MKFQELPLNNQFSTSSFPEVIFQKVKKRNGTCCTPEHNAIFDNNKKVILFKNIHEIFCHYIFLLEILFYT